MKKEIPIGLIICIGFVGVVAVGVSTDSKNSDIILNPDGGFFAAAT